MSNPDGALEDIDTAWPSWGGTSGGKTTTIKAYNLGGIGRCHVSNRSCLPAGVSVSLLAVSYGALQNQIYCIVLLYFCHDSILT